MIEAMAAGCPVTGFNKGSIPEVVADKKTGFVVSDVDEMIDAVLALDSIDRKACREHVINNFTADKMADGYEAVYKKILANKS